jgi:peptidoglycan/LPS O-acetylase OafA/YrhL
MIKITAAQPPSKYYGLDNLRALAIIMVFFFHYQRWFEHPAWMPKALSFGWTGVDLFFVLSGFLISSQLFAQIKKVGSFSMRDFYIKRFFRILPIYYFVLAIYFFIPFFSNKQALAPLWKFLTFTQNFGADFTNQRAFGVVWSLCVEEHFYLLMPVILLLFLKTGLFKKGYLLLIVLFMAGFLIRLYSWYDVYLHQTNGLENRMVWVATIYYPTYNRLDGLLAGVSIAALYNYLPVIFYWLSKYANALIVAGLIILTGTYFLCGNTVDFARSIFSFPLVSIGFGCVVLGAIMPNSFLYKWKSTVLTKIAELSYALYLVHMAIILLVQTIFSNLGIAKNSSWMLLLSITLCLAIALLLHHVIEKPFMKMRERFLKPDSDLQSDLKVAYLNPQI